MPLQTIQPENRRKIRIFINDNGEIYQEGEIVGQYDNNDNFIEYVKIRKFLKHTKNGEERLYVSFESTSFKTKKWTLDIDYLGKFYKKC